MKISAKLRRAPLRLASGAYILNAGASKWGADEATAKRYHGFASGTYPFFSKVEPKLFTKALSIGEMSLGTALLLPIFPAGLVGLGLTGFAGGLLGLYVRTPGMHDQNFRWTQDGQAMAKDVWLLGIGSSLLIDAALSESKVTSTEASVVPEKLRSN